MLFRSKRRLLFYVLLQFEFSAFATKVDLFIRTKNIINVPSELMSTVRANRVAVFMQNFENITTTDADLKNIDELVKSISMKNSILIVEASTLRDPKKYFGSGGDIDLQNARSTTLLASISTSNHFAPLFKRTIDFVCDWSDNQVRPYFLSFMVSESSVNLTDDLFKYAWDKKFLDATNVGYSTINNTKCQSDVYVQTYNPFTKKNLLDCYSASSTKLFPDKLRNLNGAKLKVSLVRRPPSVDFDRDASQRPINVVGTDIAIIRIIAEYMNISVELVAPSISGYAQKINDSVALSLLHLIADGSIDFSANQVFYILMARSYNGHHGLISKLIYFDDFIAVVPIFPAPIWHLRFGPFFIVVSIVIHVTVIYLCVKLCRFDVQRFWSPHRILQMLLASSTPSLPSRLVERFVFFLIFVLAHVYSAMLYSQLTRIRLNTMSQGPFEEVADLRRYPNITLLTNPNYINITLDPTDPLRQKLHMIENIMDCPDEILARGNVACLMDKSLATNKLDWSSKRGSANRMKIMRHVFWSAPKGFVASSNSPYLPSFDKVLRRVIEHGLWFKFRIDNGVTWRRSKFSGADDELGLFDHNLRAKLLWILATGYFMATIAFLSEVIVRLAMQKSRSST
uniref:Ionotropic glutamate receptor C-terminal domain-containing protein n=1 Tax=Trichogramma kaykai TaxID=54128 RepID=A0ABD2WS70_9HYME